MLAFLFILFMPHAESLEAIVLKTYDVGEADRFCVLFTRERGRIAARASGARRIKSRLGSLLLPFQHIHVELKESGNSWIVASASRLQREENRGSSTSAFTALQEGIELLLRLVSDEGALPDVFDSTMRFIDACYEGIPHASLGFSFTLLHQLGLFPEEKEVQATLQLSSADHAYLQECRGGQFVIQGPQCDIKRLSKLRIVLLEAQLQAPLKSQAISAMIA